MTQSTMPSLAMQFWARSHRMSSSESFPAMEVVKSISIDSSSSRVKVCRCRSDGRSLFNGLMLRRWSFCGASVLHNLLILKLRSSLRCSSILRFLVVSGFQRTLQRCGKGQVNTHRIDRIGLSVDKIQVGFCGAGEGIGIFAGESTKTLTSQYNSNTRLKQTLNHSKTETGSLEA